MVVTLQWFNIKFFTHDNQQDREIELATLWKMEMQYYGKMICNFR